jgi:RNA polymerase sigma-70 factor (ECF subfamily)
MDATRNRFSTCQDEELMRLVCMGEEAAFDEIYARYGKRLYVYFFRMLNFSKPLAEDALQDLFLKVAEKPELFDCSRSFKTWIFSIASNICKNVYRNKMVRTSHAPAIENEIALPLDGFALAAGRLDHAEFVRILNESLQELPPAKREVFILRFQEEKSIAEIAAIQGIAEGSVKSRLHYTLKLLSGKLSVFNPVN